MYSEAVNETVKGVGEKGFLSSNQRLALKELLEFWGASEDCFIQAQRGPEIIQGGPENPRDAQRYPETPRKLQICQEILTDTQRGPVMPRDT